LLITKYSGDEVKKNETAGHAARMEQRRVSYRGSVRKRGDWRLLGRPKRKWEDDIKIDLQEVGWEHGLDRSGSG
jgi:hypothetical protein